MIHYSDLLSGQLILTLNQYFTFYLTPSPPPHDSVTMLATNQWKFELMTDVNQVCHLCPATNQSQHLF